MTLSEDKLWEEINRGLDLMTFDQLRLWNVLKVAPSPWSLRGHDACWVVGLIGSTLVYYNHHEHGFNISPWSQFGQIESYHSMQYGLNDVVQRVLMWITSGHDIGPRDVT